MPTQKESAPTKTRLPRTSLAQTPIKTGSLSAFLNDDGKLCVRDDRTAIEIVLAEFESDGVVITSPRPLTVTPIGDYGLDGVVIEGF